MKSFVKIVLQSLDWMPWLLSHAWTFEIVVSDGAINCVSLDKERCFPYSLDLGSETSQKTRSKVFKLLCFRAKFKNISSDGGSRSSFSQPCTFHALTSWLFSRMTYSSVLVLQKPRLRKVRQININMELIPFVLESRRKLEELCDCPGKMKFHQEWRSMQAFFKSAKIRYWPIRMIATAVRAYLPGEGYQFLYS